MIVGNGLIAKSLHEIDSSDIIFLASGVSNSKCTDNKEFKREIELVKKHIDNTKKIVYFSSVKEYITNNLYLEHKEKIENIIKQKTDKFIILQLPQLIGDNGNKSNLINFYYEKINNYESFDLYKVKRSLLDIDDLVNILNHLLKINFNGVFTINYIELIDTDILVKIIESLLQKKSIINSEIKLVQNIKKNELEVNNILNMFVRTKSYNELVIKKYLNKK